MDPILPIKNWAYIYLVLLGLVSGWTGFVQEAHEEIGYAGQITPFFTPTRQVWLILYIFRNVGNSPTYQCL